jgi:hypothetical protein
MPLLKRITQTVQIQEEIIERIPITTYIEKKRIITREVKREVLNHKEVEYKNKKYIIGYCNFNEKEDILFVFDDNNNKEKIINRKWHTVSNDYISSTIIDENDYKSKQLYLHNFVMDRLTFNGKGKTQSIDHINRIGRDNRKENLRELSQTQQNYNQSKRERNIELPPGCGINPNDIPTNIFYRKSDGIHGDRFLIDIKLPAERIRDQSTSSKNIDLKTKLEEIKLKLKKIKEEHLEIKEIDQLVDNIKQRNDLRRSFNDILKLSGFPQAIIDKNLAPLEGEPEKVETIDQDAKDLAKQLIDEGFKGVSSNLPENCGVTANMIPKYCYYKPASEKRGDKFIIERHPELIKLGKRQWTTTESKSKTTKEKYDLMIEKINTLNNL